MTEDWYFWSHRLALARAARSHCRAVVVATRLSGLQDQIRDAGLQVIPIALRRNGWHPWRELAAIWNLWRIYRRERPDLVHHVALKPVVYGSVVAWLCRVPAVVNALAGLGYAFTPGTGRRTWLRRVVRVALAGALRLGDAICIVQNPDDRRVLVDLGLEPRRIATIRGSGVDPSLFAPSPEPSGPVVATIVSRLLWNKGVSELVEAARIMRTQGESVRVRLVGSPDPRNPASIPERQLDAWRREGVVEYTGAERDIPAVWRASHIAVLPSYREGLPRSLLEAAASGRPLIATDVPGCREIVRDGETGILVPPRDAVALSAAILRLAKDSRLRVKMGKAARTLAVAEFSEERVVAETLALYQRVLGVRWKD